MNAFVEVTIASGRRAARCSSRSAVPRVRTIGTMHSAFPDLLKVYGNPVDYGDIGSDALYHQSGVIEVPTVKPSRLSTRVSPLASRSR